MAFTKIAGKPGHVRHVPTGFVCREVFNLTDLINCNGVIVEWGDTTWRWMAGRDMHDLMVLRNVDSLIAMCAAMDTIPGYRGSFRVFDDAMTAVVSYPMMVDPSTYIKTASGYAGTITRTPRLNPKIYGILTGVFAGHGQSYVGGLNSVSGGDMLGWPIAQGDNLTYSLSDNGTSNDPGFAARKAQLVNHGKVGGTYDHPTDFTALLGTAVIAVPLGKSWGQFKEDLIATLPHSEKSEVQQKCREKMDPLVAQLTKVSPVPMIYVPIEIYADGWAMVDPLTFVRVLSPFAYNLPADCYSLFAPVRGGAVVCDKGIIHTSWRWWDNSARTPGQPRSWVRGSTPDIATSENATAKVTLKGVDTKAIGAIDGVRLERILGGLAGCNLSDTGEKDPISTANFTTNQLVDLWWGKLRFASPAGYLSRSTTAQGVVETDAQYEARVTAAPRILESSAASRPTTWDTHGFSAYHGMTALLASLDGDKASSRWLQQTWLARRYMWLEPTCAQNGTYMAVGVMQAPVSPLLGD